MKRVKGGCDHPVVAMKKVKNGPLPSSSRPLSGRENPFALREELAIQDFGEESLVLLRDALELRRINAASRQMLALLETPRTAASLAHALGLDVAEVEDTLHAMETQRIIRRIVNMKQKRDATMQNPKYLANPDVSFRPEDDEGAILFNADTEGLEVINPTAMEIWKTVATPRTETDVVTHLCEVFDDAPREQVAKDVSEFLESMVEKGFIGIVEEKS